MDLIEISEQPYYFENNYNQIQFNGTSESNN